MRACAPPRQMWQIASASASAASAGLGRRVEPQQPGHHRGDLRLVGAAAAGDRRLDLAGRVQRDRQPAPGGATACATPLAWAVPITVRTLCWLKTRSTATASGRCSSSQASMPRSISHSRWRQVRSGGVRTTPTATSAAAGGRPSPRRRRGRSGSGRGRRRARACSPASSSEHLFGPTLAEAGPHPAHDTRRRTAAASALRRRGHSMTSSGTSKLREDVLHVVEVLERLDQPEHLAGAVLVELDLHARARTTPRPSRSRCRRPAARCARRPGRWPR